MSIVRLPAQREIRQRVGRTVRRGLTALGLVAMLTATSLGQGRCYRTCPPACPAPCPPGQSAYGVPGGTVYAPGQAAPSPQQAPGATDAAPAPSPQPAAPSDIVSPEMFAASQSAGFGGSPASAAPAMIGDFIGSGGYFHPDSYNHSPGGNNPIAGGDRRFKISENMTPIPTDRVFFSYNHFHNALIVDDPATDLRRDINFDRYTFGFESTALFGGWASLEVRIPFGDGLDSDQIGDPRGETVFSPTGTELGNVVLVAKSYIHRSCCGALTGGVAFVIPTADDARQLRYDDATGISTVMRQVENDSFHIQPFLGALWTPSNCFFAQAYISADFDMNGYDVWQRDTAFTNLRFLGNYDDQDLLHFDLKLGYWMYKNNACTGLISGIAPTVELHYTTATQDADMVSDGLEPVVFSPLNRYDNLNITGGVHVALRNQSTFTFYGAFPLEDDEDEFTGLNSNFDAEVGVQYNCYF
ncbi:MAG: hypothetical protein GXY83_19390 [Rhodopirellula sp.]|nr:hypothetical protein [Rhodopirellula sp.]